MLLAVLDLSLGNSLLVLILDNLDLVNGLFLFGFSLLKLCLVVSDSLVASLDFLLLDDNLVFVDCNVSLVDLLENNSLCLELLLEFCLLAGLLAMSDLSLESVNSLLDDSLFNDLNLMESLVARLLDSLVLNKFLVKLNSLGTVSLVSLLSEFSNLVSDFSAGLLVDLSFFSDLLESLVSVLSQLLLEGLA